MTAICPDCNGDGFCRDCPMVGPLAGADLQIALIDADCECCEGCTSCGGSGKVVYTGPHTAGPTTQEVT